MFSHDEQSLAGKNDVGCVHSRDAINASHPHRRVCRGSTLIGTVVMHFDSLNW